MQKQYNMCEESHLNAESDEVDTHTNNMYVCQTARILENTFW